MLVGVTTKAKELAAALLFRDAHMMKAIMAEMPGLYEWLTDEAAPSSDPTYTQTVSGEDHSASSLDGGLPIPRNCFISAGYGSAEQFMWEKTGLGSADGFVYADADYSTGRGANLDWHWRGYIEPGLDTATHSGLYAEALVCISVSGSSNLSLKIHNRSLSQDSATTTLTTAGLALEFVIIEDIPLNGGAKNDFRLEFSTTGEGVTVRTYAARFCTVYKAGAESRSAHSSPLSQPASSGTEVG